MNTSKILFLALVLVTTACQNTQKSQVNSQAQPIMTQDSVIGDWAGKLPCADCPFIRYTLTVKPDGTYSDVYVYENKDVMPLQTQGAWSIEDQNMLVLKDKQGNRSFFKIQKAQLMALDADKDPIPGRESEYTLLTKENK